LAKIEGWVDRLLLCGSPHMFNKQWFLGGLCSRLWAQTTIWWSAAIGNVSAPKSSLIPCAFCRVSSCGFRR
jgi:hypothetical protein